MDTAVACRHRITIRPADRSGGDLLARAAALAATGCRPLFYWEHPVTGDALLAAGSAHTIVAAGPERLLRADAVARAIVARLDVNGAEPPAPTPRFVGGFGFARNPSPDPLWRDFPSCAFFLPERLWLQSGSTTWVLQATPCEHGGPFAAEGPSLDTRVPTDRNSVGAAISAQSDADPPVPSPSNAERAHWTARVERALSLIADASVSKLVLSRRRAWSVSERLDPPRMLRQLRAGRPACVTFWCASSDSHFVGSTPELLLRAHGRQVESFALAGTALRRRGDEDAARGTALLASAKDRREHDAVLRGICAALDPLAESLHTCAEPRLLTIPEAHHLRTVVTATLRTPHHVLRLADRLHPTPAVCGLPRDATWTLLEREEPERGWYTGGIGWFDVHGNGVLAVALRAALAQGRHLTLFAGAGIVAGSEPAAEFAETEAKMRPMLEAVRARGPIGCGAPTTSPAPHP